MRRNRIHRGRMGVGFSTRKLEISASRCWHARVLSPSGVLPLKGHVSRLFTTCHVVDSHVPRRVRVGNGTESKRTRPPDPYS